jgi:hypothetical protein
VDEVEFIGNKGANDVLDFDDLEMWSDRVATVAAVGSEYHDIVTVQETQFGTHGVTIEGYDDIDGYDGSMRESWTDNDNDVSIIIDGGCDDDDGVGGEHLRPTGGGDPGGASYPRSGPAIVSGASRDIVFNPLADCYIDARNADDGSAGSAPPPTPSIHFVGPKASAPRLTDGSRRMYEGQTASVHHAGTGTITTMRRNTLMTGVTKVQLDSKGCQQLAKQLPKQLSCGGDRDPIEMCIEMCTVQKTLHSKRQGYRIQAGSVFKMVGDHLVKNLTVAELHAALNDVADGEVVMLVLDTDGHDRPKKPSSGEVLNGEGDEGNPGASVM